MEAVVFLIDVLLQNLLSGNGGPHEKPQDGRCLALDSNRTASLFSVVSVC